MTRHQDFPGSQWLSFALPCLLMLATRLSHFGSAVSLPDASLAAFFFAGLLSGGRPRLLSFVLLCALAAAIDYWVIAVRGVSAYCVTPAYGFLIPTYFTLWWCGQYGSRLALSRATQWVKLGGAVWCAVSLAFVISSGSFYLFSGYMAEPNLTGFLGNVAQYYPRYLRYGAGYIALGMGLWAVCRPLYARRAPSHGH